jgi:hypothetical protein
VTPVLQDDDRDPLDDRIRELAREVNVPPPTPREEMWQAISARRGARPRRAPRPRWVPWAAAAAAVLAIGIGIGRLSVPASNHSGPAATNVAEARRVNPTAYRLAAEEHLAQSEAFLTLFRASLQRPGDHRLASATARQLLAGNRLLLDSPAARDEATRRLLEDLELVLAEIAQLSPGSPVQDLDLIRDGIERGDVLSRLRQAVPAGTVPNHGAL